MFRKLARRPCAVVTALLPLLLAAPGAAPAQDRPVPDTFTATTTDMTPSGITLRIQVLEWSDESARETVIATLNEETDRPRALSQLPTVGYVWPSGSPVGYALKYAHRAPSGDGERITVVTDKLVGVYGLKPWTANDASAATALDYSVIELVLDREGSGEGTMSLAAEVVFDDGAHTVSLATGDATPNVLTAAKVEPKPYWAEGG